MNPPDNPDHADLVQVPLHVVLVHPEIPPNTGNVGRLCVGVGAHLHLVRPLGFDIDDKAVRRAGLDYWRKVRLTVHDDLDAFWAWFAAHTAAASGQTTPRLHLFSSHGRKSIARATFGPGDVLLFGRETKGLPKELIATHGAWRLPLPGPVRSLNLSNAVAVAVYTALAQVAPALFEDQPASDGETP